MIASRSLRRILGLVGGLTLALTIAQAQSRTTYSGRAYAAFVNTSITGPVYLSDTGQLPSSGGVIGNSLLAGNVPGVLSANVLVASTSASSGQADSSASLADVDVLPGSPAELRATFIRAETHANCANGPSGSSEIAGLQFGGQTVTVTGQPNQTVTIPGVATLIINEQSMGDSNGYHEANVNAIHLIVPGVAEVILSSAHSDIHCAKTSRGPCHDFVTGGGWITTAGGKGNFGFNVGLKSETKPLTAHFNWVDQGAKVHMKANSATIYGGTGNTRHFEGTCEVNGVAGFTYICDVTDNGEPGRGADIMSLTISNGYSASGVLAGGNIQLHDPCH